MPIYEYGCDRCQVKCELLRAVDKRDDEVICEKCGHTMPRLTSQCSFRLVGNGWFKDSKGETEGATGYGITEREINKNLENEKRVTDKIDQEVYGGTFSDGS